MRRSEKGEAAAMARQTGSLDGEVGHWGVPYWMRHTSFCPKVDKSCLLPMGIISDNLYLKIGGRMVYLWRAVDAEGEVLDVLVQAKRNEQGGVETHAQAFDEMRLCPRQARHG